MALPKLNETPKYSLKVPSTGKEIRFRPFLVKEERMLMIAMESGVTKDMLNAIADTLAACIEDLDVKTLTTFDVEYMFTQVRAKSVGETTTVGIQCEECDHSNEVTIKLDDLKVDVPTLEPMIKLNDTYTLEVRWPAFDTVANMANIETTTTTEQAFSVIKACMVSLLTEDNRIDLQDTTGAELEDFIDSMSKDQFKKVQEFIEAMPAFKHEVNITCASCKHEQTKTIEGMQNFF